MGYVRPTLKLVFDDPEFEGLVVRAKRLSVGKALELAGLSDLKDLKETSPEFLEKFGQLLATVAGVILSWNLEAPEDPADPDSPTASVPVTAEALADQDMGFVWTLIGALQDATLGVSAPLAPRSSSGGPSLEASLPMDLLSASPESLPTPS